MSPNSKKVNPHTAFHIAWDFRREAAIWEDDKPLRLNFRPIASTLRKWLLNQGVLFRSTSDELKEIYTNPYTNSGWVLALTFSEIVNESAAVSKSFTTDSGDIELKRIRLYNELVLYSARICECLIKQLLFCSDFPEDLYKNSALGGLLTMDCRGCMKQHKRKHKLSLLGSLAHRYQLCAPYEHCVEQHMKLVNRRRNVEAAHSDSIDFNPTTVGASQARLDAELTEIGENLIHMLQHIADIELKMWEELRKRAGFELEAPVFLKVKPEGFSPQQ
jgi:hypothetical protein